jgi:hypothetical protein
MFGPKKYEFLFWGNSICFGTHTFLAHPWARTSMSSFFFWNSYFFVGTHTFFDAMFGPKKYESCLFPELLFFWVALFWWTKCLDFSEMFFSGTLESKFLCCWIVFVFADKLLHFISFLSFGDFRFSWTCVVSLCVFFVFLERIFSRISVVDSWLLFCVFEETSDVLHPKPVFFFGTFFTLFLQNFSKSYFLERPDLVCNYNKCSILGVFYFLELRT